MEAAKQGQAAEAEVGGAAVAWGPPPAAAAAYEQKMAEQSA